MCELVETSCSLSAARHVCLELQMRTHHMLNKHIFICTNAAFIMEHCVEHAFLGVIEIVEGEKKCLNCSLKYLMLV